MLPRTWQWSVCLLFTASAAVRRDADALTLVTVGVTCVIFTFS